MDQLGSILFVCFLTLCIEGALCGRELGAAYQLLHIVPLSQENQNSLAQQAQNLDWWTESAQDANGASLTLRVMHRDSPSSPFSDPHATPQQVLRERLGRDAARVESLSLRARIASLGLKSGDLAVEAANFTIKEEAISHFSGPVMSGLKQGSGEYFISLGVGTPASRAFLVLDTGSDILWLQCAPCEDCYPQTVPVFNPRASSSFQRLLCTSSMCSELELHTCQPRTKHCIYQVAYGDGSFTEGDFSMETLSFNGATMRSVALGCGHDNEGLFVGASGLLGLGGGPLSFPSQMGAYYGKTFSYCLVDRDQQGFSSLIFGNAAIPRGTVFTPLVKNLKLNTFYYVSLTGISVGGDLLTIPASAFKIDGTGNGGVIVDSGTSVTRLVETAYGPLRSAFRAATRSLPSTGGVALFDTCYDLSGRTSVRVPTVAFHFGTAAVPLPPKNFLIPVDNQGTYCLAFASTAGELSIIGNVQQQGFRVVFDGKYSRIGFAANQC